MGHPGARVRTATFRLLRLSMLPQLARETLQRRAVTVVLYHDPDPAMLEHHLSVLRRSYTFIGLRSFVDAVRDGTTGSLPPKSLVLTFDDGHKGNHELLGLLDRLGVPATIFLCASIAGTSGAFWFNHVDDPGHLKRISDHDRLDHLARLAFDEDGGSEAEALSDEDIREMLGPVVDFQSHGLSHAILTRCGDEKARREIIESRAQLSSRYGLDVYAFAYPNGDYSPRELALVREAGYRCAVTIEQGYNTAATDPYRLRRICIDDRDGVDELVVKTSGVWAVVRRLLDRRRRSPDLA